MKANPGGQIAANEVVGRDDLIRDLWDILETQSVLMTAERRIGKTSVIQKMLREPRAGWFPIYQDLERVHQAEEFALAVYDEIQKFLGGLKKTANRAQRFLEQRGLILPGVIELAAKESSWKDLLRHAVEDLVSEQAPSRLVFLWDEMPYMLENIRRRSDTAAVEVLDVLRSLRQTHPAFRMLLTGSIGLHHVLTRLKEARFSNEPVNDMYPVEVRPLAPQHAQDLAQRLLEGERIPAPDPSAAAEAIAREADYVPFYIHHIVRCLKMTRRTATPQVVSEILREQLVDANDPWELDHYRDRIAGYYPHNDDAQLVLLILDELSAANEVLEVNQILAGLKAQTPLADRTRLLNLLRTLERDHYVSRTPDGEYQFLFPLVKRWWKLDRGL
jgi:hypothetical protein